MDDEHEELLSRHVDRPYPFAVAPEAGGGYLITFPDLPGCVAHIDSLAGIDSQVEEIREHWLETVYAEGGARSSAIAQEGYSGRFNVRLPRSLHRWLAESAAAEGVSLNLYVATLLARGNSQARIERRLEDATRVQSEGGGSAMATVETNKAVIRRFYDELWNQGNLAVADQILAPGMDREGFKQYVAQTRAASGYHHTIEDLIAEGDRVVAVVTGRGTRRRFMGFAGPGTPFSEPGIVIFRVVDGKIVEQTPRWEGPRAKPSKADRFANFTQRARTVLALAEDEARRFNHNYIGTEHLLLGLVREGDGVAAKVLENLGLELSAIRSSVAQIIGEGDHPSPGEIGLTPRAKKVIGLAIEEARGMNHHYIGTEHLLLGLVREGEGIAAGVLESLGVNLERLRAETTRILSEVTRRK